MDRGDALIYQQIKKSHYNKYFIELACSVRIGEYWSRSFFARLWTSPAARSINLQKKELEHLGSLSKP